MSTISEIKEAIAKLSPKDYCELMADLFFEDDAWDQQMRKDGATGKFDQLNREAEKERYSGLIEKWP